MTAVLLAASSLTGWLAAVGMARFTRKHARYTVGSSGQRRGPSGAGRDSSLPTT